jgi:hypothetical protein
VRARAGRGDGDRGRPLEIRRAAHRLSVATSRWRRRSSSGSVGVPSAPGVGSVLFAVPPARAGAIASSRSPIAEANSFSGRQQDLPFDDPWCPRRVDSARSAESLQ